MRQDNLAYQYEKQYSPKTGLEYKTEKIANQGASGNLMIHAEKTKTGKKTKTVNKGAKKKSSPRTVFCVAILACMAFLVLFRGLKINSGYDALEQKNAVLSETITENQKLQFKIDQMLDLKNIENIAQNNYNMGVPAKSQIVYISLDQTDEVKKVKDSGTVFGRIQELLNGIVEYFS